MWRWRPGRTWPHLRPPGLRGAGRRPELSFGRAVYSTSVQAGPEPEGPRPSASPRASNWCTLGQWSVLLALGAQLLQRHWALSSGPPSPTGPQATHAPWACFSPPGVGLGVRPSPRWTPQPLVAPDPSPRAPEPAPHPLRLTVPPDWLRQVSTDEGWSSGEDRLSHPPSPTPLGLDPTDDLVAQLHGAETRLRARLAGRAAMELLAAGSVAPAWVELAWAAQQGDAESQHNMGYAYEKGVGRPRDVSQAHAWYARAACQDYPPAVHNLAVCYELGWGVAPDPVQARALYQRARKLEAREPMPVPPACAACQAQGWTPTDVSPLPVQPDALFHLARAHQWGLAGLPVDRAWACDLYTRAGQLGHAAARRAARMLRADLEPALHSAQSTPDLRAAEWRAPVPVRSRSLTHLTA